METAEPLQITITLNADGVVAPALRTMRRASEIVAFTLNSLADADLSLSPRPRSNSLHVLSFGDEPKDYDRKSDFVDWVLERGFRDIAHGIRASLEEAFLYISVAGAQPPLTTSEGINDWLTGFRLTASKKNFVQLIDAVNAGLTEPMSFSDEFLSLQKVRNCLEHRQGIVGDNDADHEKGMRLALPRMKLFMVIDGQEVEIERGHRVEKGGLISLRRETKERFFPLGARVSFSAAEFDEIAMASYFFASDLATKLPRLMQQASSKEED